ncbi:DNA primase [Candidatus Woesearchaeota archaeon]|nr:DNA primase [Candidatus Woesearchaeota archaeon]
MAKLAQNFAKYVIHAKLRAKGVVEKPDVIGAIFGQTEGLLGGELDLRELQHTGRIGRIEVNVKTDKGKAYADIIIPSSLDASETALIAASLETIDKVGPCTAQIMVVKVEDVRTQKRKYVIDRAKEIMRAMLDTSAPEAGRLAEVVKEAVRSWEVSDYQGLACGPDIMSSDELIVVEGRADVINLLKNGIRNSIAIEGSNIPQPVIELTRKKITTAFLDGDRGGDLDMKKLLALAEIDFIARADEGKEVEELSKKEIYKALREKTPTDQFNEKNGKVAREYREEVLEDAEEQEPEIAENVDEKTRVFFSSLLEDLVGTRAAYIIDKDMQIVSKVPVAEIGDMLDFNAHAIIIDGKVNQPLVNLASQRNIKYVVAMGCKEKIEPHSTRVLTLKELR